MCLLTYFPSNVLPDHEALYNGTITNDDGHGFAIVTGNRLIIRHGMNALDMIDLFCKMRRKFHNGPALFHSRFGTGGEYSRLNCHPFRFRGDRHTVVAHNGILPSLVQPSKKDRRCDTRIAAEELLPSGFGHLSKKSNRDLLASWIGKYNKLVILTVNPDYGQSAYIINEKSGIWDGGIWYSNFDYLPMVGWTAADANYYAEEFCVVCEDWGSIDPELGCCTKCETCVDCKTSWLDCECYLPYQQRAEQREIESRQDSHILTEKEWWDYQADREMRAIEAGQ